MNATMLQNTVSSLQTQMKLDKASLHAKDLRIKSLEDSVIETGVDPSNTEVAKKLIRQKNEDISALGKQLKLSQSEHPQEREVLQEKKEKEETIQLVLEMTA